MDVLTEVLRFARTSNQIYGRLELGAPWGMRVEGSAKLAFYAVSRGSAVLDTGKRRGRVPITLAAGDFVFVREHIPHTLKDDPKSRAVTVAEVYAQRGGRCGGLVSYGGSGAPTSIVAGGFSFETSLLDPVVACLPEVLHVKGDTTLAAEWLDTTLRFMATEMSVEDPGYGLVASRLADVLFVQALRTYVRESPSEQNGFLRALGDPVLGISFQRMHERPADPWTVESLAKAVSMSRSAFAARFTEVLGVPPLTYLSRWRMHRAAEKLRACSSKVGEIAHSVGYETDGAFVKAFRKHFDETPGAYRKRHLAAR